MRDQGRLVEWFDDKGYGFIQPNDSKKVVYFYTLKILQNKVHVQSWAVLYIIKLF